MKVDVSHVILAVITGESDGYSVSGGAPIFCIRDEAERARVARDIGILTLANVHDLRNGTYIVVKH